MREFQGSPQTNSPGTHRRPMARRSVVGLAGALSLAGSFGTFGAARALTGGSLPKSLGRPRHLPYRRHWRANRGTTAAQAGL